MRLSMGGLSGVSKISKESDPNSISMNGGPVFNSDTSMNASVLNQSADQIQVQQGQQGQM